MAVTDFNMQIGISKSTGQTRTTTGKAYKTTKQRFMIGKDDVYNLNVALNRQGEATINYFGISCSYWKYKVLPSFRPLINKYKFSYYDDVIQCYITGNNSQSYSGY